MALKTLVYKVKQTSSGIPPQVRHFAVRGAILFAAWCLVYGLILKPYRLVDPLLTNATGGATTWVMQYFYQDEHPSAVYTDKGVLINLNNRQALSVWDACNGLELYALFTGFILCVPMSKRKTATYIIGGIAGIFVLNVLRCLALVYLFEHHSPYADMAHHYFFQLAVYAAIFIVWERYFKSLKVANETPAQV